MKNVFKLFTALFTFALIFTFTACQPDDDDPDKINTGQNPNQNPNQDDDNSDDEEDISEQYRNIYNQFLLGEWVETYAEYPDYNRIKPDGMTIVFKDNEVQLPKGYWIEDSLTNWTVEEILNLDRTYSNQIITLPINKNNLTELSSPTRLEYCRLSFPMGHTSYFGQHFLYDENGDILWDGNKPILEYNDFTTTVDDSIYYSINTNSNGTFAIWQRIVKGPITRQGDNHYFIRKNNSNNEPGDGNDNIDIKGAYSFTANSYTHTLAFNDNGSYAFTSGSGQASQNKSGNWSISGSTLTLGTSSPVSLSEEFTVSSSGNSYTLALKGGGSVSQILSTFTVIGNTLTMTKNN